jgi:hypothetical protein
MSRPPAVRRALRAEALARVALTLGALLPYWRLLTFRVIFVTDDYFTSDIFNGELPGRVLVGQLIRKGEWPTWTNQLCSGIPLAGTPADPIGLAAFALLPPAPALDLMLIVLLLVAAHGAYGLARRIGADRAGAVLAGIAFAGSGYIACQLKHLAIVSTVAWLPLGLLVLDVVLESDGATTARRALFTAMFGLVFAVQVLSGFPQSVYICSLAYGAFAVFRAVGRRKNLGPLKSAGLLGGIGAATLLGAAAGAIVLLPLAALAGTSDRSGSLGYAWAARQMYWPRNVLTFVLPYVNGDISDNSYVGPPMFWEDYGYVGVATVLLAIYSGLRERRSAVEVFVLVMTVGAYLLVLGPSTPVFKIAYYTLPGMSLFRLPTRFLVVVDLGIALLGGIGLTRLRVHLARRLSATSRVPQFVVLAICAGTALDLFVHQPRQNPMVQAAEWLALPRSVAAIRADGAEPRTFTPEHMAVHGQAFGRAHGWADLAPYFALREVLEPNTGGGYWNMPSADCYAGAAPRWYVDVWGSHNGESLLISPLVAVDFDAARLRVDPALPTVLKTFGVTHLLSPYPEQGATLTLIDRDVNAYVYRVEGSARVRVVRGARLVKTDREAAARLQAADFDPNLEILLHAVSGPVHPTTDEAAGELANAATGSAVVMREHARQVVIDAEAPADAFLLLADTFYPGWTAQIDGLPAPIYRANISLRGVPLPKGRHVVTFSFDPPGVARGLQVSAAATGALLLWAGTAAWTSRRRL